MQCGVRRIVFTSSVAIYGFPEYEYDEDGPKHPFNDYGKSKLEAEAVYQEWLNAAPENRLQVVRPTAIFGEGNRGNIYNLFHQLARRRFLMIGNGKNKKSIAYVGNVAAFLKWYIEADPAKYKVCNFIDKPDLDMYDLVALFEKDFRRKVTLPVTLPYWLGLLGGYGFDVLAWVLHRSLPISSIRIRKFCAQSIFSTRRLEETGFIPPFTIEEGIRRTIAFEFSPKK